LGKVGKFGVNQLGKVFGYVDNVLSGNLGTGSVVVVGKSCAAPPPDCLVFFSGPGFGDGNHFLDAGLGDEEPEGAE
jgi:hypothetical protein